jgi:hypothetical protein
VPTPLLPDAVERASHLGSEEQLLHSEGVIETFYEDKTQFLTFSLGAVTWESSEAETCFLFV